MKRSLIIVLLLVAATPLITSAESSLEEIKREMGPQKSPEYIPAKFFDHPHERVDAMIDAAILAAEELGFDYDPSESVDGVFRINPQWKGEPVTVTFRYKSTPDDNVTYTYAARAGGLVLAEAGQVKIVNLFLATVERVLEDSPQQLETTNGVSSSATSTNRAKPNQELERTP